MPTRPTGPKGDGERTPGGGLTDGGIMKEMLGPEDPERDRRQLRQTIAELKANGAPDWVIKTLEKGLK